MKVSGLLLERNSIKQLEQGSLDWTEMVKLFASDNFEGQYGIGRLESNYLTKLFMQPIA